jgi:hypothetical protein
MGSKQTVRTRILGNFAEAQINLGTVTTLDTDNVKRRVICWQFSTILLAGGDRGGTVVKVLCYKSEGRWFDSDGVIGIFH